MPLEHPVTFINNLYAPVAVSQNLESLFSNSETKILNSDRNTDLVLWTRDGVLSFWFLLPNSSWVSSHILSKYCFLKVSSKPAHNMLFLCSDTEMPTSLMHSAYYSLKHALAIFNATVIV